MRRWRKKKNRRVQTEQVSHSQRRIDILNYCPGDYLPTTEWVSFNRSAEKTFRASIRKTQVDEMDADMMVPQIEAEKYKVLTCAQTQRVKHIRLCRHQAGILEEALTICQNRLEEARALREQLTADLAKLEQKEETLQ